MASGHLLPSEPSSFLPRPRPRRLHSGVSETAGGTPSALSAFHCRIEFTEFDAGVLGGELPIGPDGGGVTPVLPSVDVALQRRPVADPVRQIAAKGAQLDFGHVQP